VYEIVKNMVSKIHNIFIVSEILPIEFTFYVFEPTQGAILRCCNIKCIRIYYRILDNMAANECTVSRVGHSGTATSTPPAPQLLKHNLLYDVATLMPALSNLQCC